MVNNQMFDSSMNLRIRTWTILSLAILAGCSTPEPPPLVSGPNPLVGSDLSKAPNILMIVVDDMGFTDLGVLGSEIETPTIDALAAEGVLFDNFHVSTVCAPTRAMLLSGVDNHRAGLGTMGPPAPDQRGQPGYEDRLNDNVVSVARLLGDAGYHTVMAGKWHLGPKAGQRPADRGFARSFALLEAFASHYATGNTLGATYYLDHDEVELPEDFYSTDDYTDRLIEFIGDGRDIDRPFFAYAAYTAPHFPLHAPDKTIQKYLETYAEGWDAVRRQRFDRVKALGLVPADTVFPERHPDVPAWKSLDAEEQKIEARKMAIYAAMVDNVDSNIARLLQHLRDTGRYQDTLILFMSDNGPDANVLSDNAFFSLMSLGSDNSYDNLGLPDSYVSYGLRWAHVSSTYLAGYKGMTTEGGIRAPLIVWWPSEIAGGRRDPALTHVVDITPTLLDVAGITHPGSHYRGRDIEPPIGGSLMPRVTNASDEVARPVEALGFELFGQRALIKGDWKILARQGAHGDGRWELYNLANDPTESNDLAAQMPEHLASMVQEFEHYVAENGVIVQPPDYQGPGVLNLISYLLFY